MTVHHETLEELIRLHRDDADILDMLTAAMEAFEDYHRAIYRLEMTRRLSACGAPDAETFRAETASRDRLRTACHNDVLAHVGFLNRLAEQAGLPPFYPGTVSEARPYRREVADAVLAWVREVILARA